METNTYRIRDICAIKSGKRLPAGCDFSDSPTNYRYIRSRDIKFGKILLDDIAYIDEITQKRIRKYIINDGDVAITIVANIGDIGYATSDCDGINLTENAVRLTQFNKQIVYSKYLAYYLGQSSMKAYMENLAAGAAQAREGYLDSFQRFMESLVRSSKKEVTAKGAIKDMSNSRISLKAILSDAIDDCKKVPTPVKKILKDRLFYRCSNSKQ